MPIHPDAAPTALGRCPSGASVMLRVLGEVQAIGPAGAFVPGRSRPGAVLAMLAMHAGECVPSERLLEELWPADAEAPVTKRVQVNVLRLRRSLGALLPGVDAAALVRTHSRGYSLQVDPESIDAVRFERLVMRGRAELDAGAARAAAQTLRLALGLWRDDPYGDFAYECFAVAEIRRLEELHAFALEARAEAELENGACGPVAVELERLVARYPLRERLRALLMIALYRSRRQSEALAAFQAARNTLVAEIGIEPGLELRALHGAILDQCPSLESGRWTPLARGQAASGSTFAQAA